jgi:hypothetical protein
MSYDNTNRGILAKNTTATNVNAPDYKGSINVNGVEYWLSAWTKDVPVGSKISGKKYFQLSIQPKEQQPQKSDTVVQSAAQSADLSSEEDLPF